MNPIKDAKLNGMPHRVSLSGSKESRLKLTEECFRTSLRLAATTKSFLTDLGIDEEVLPRLPLVRGLSSSFEALAGAYYFSLYRILTPRG